MVIVSKVSSCYERSLSKDGVRILLTSALLGIFTTATKPFFPVCHGCLRFVRSRKKGQESRERPFLFFSISWFSRQSGSENMVVSLLSPNNTLPVPCVQALQEAPKPTKWRHHAILASYRTITQPHDLDLHFHSFSLFLSRTSFLVHVLSLSLSSLGRFTLTLNPLWQLLDILGLSGSS